MVNFPSVYGGFQFFSFIGGTYERCTRNLGGGSAQDCAEAHRPMYGFERFAVDKKDDKGPCFLIAFKCQCFEEWAITPSGFGATSTSECFHSNAFGVLRELDLILSGWPTTIYEPRNRYESDIGISVDRCARSVQESPGEAGSGDEEQHSALTVGVRCRGTGTSDENGSGVKWSELLLYWHNPVPDEHPCRYISVTFLASQLSPLYSHVTSTNCPHGYRYYYGHVELE
jgi:hypothetical protein